MPKYKRRLYALSLLLLFLSSASVASAITRLQGFCQDGGKTITIAGLLAQTKVQQSYPSCTVTVYLAGTTTLAPIYSDDNLTPTPKANPFTAATNGAYFFYGVNGRYDVKLSGGGIPSTFTIGDYLLYDPATFDIDITSTKYQAKCDGVLDDSAAIQAAINAAVQVGGNVLFPQGRTCNLGTTGLLIPVSQIGISLTAPSFGYAKLIYFGTGAAITVGAVGTDTYTYRHTIENLQIDISNAGPNAIGILTYPALFWRYTKLRIVSNNSHPAATNMQIGMKFQGGDHVDKGFGAHGVWDQCQVQGKFRYGVYMTANENGWGFNANVFQGGTINYEGTAPAAQTPPYTGFFIFQGNQNYISAIDSENWDVGWRSDAFDNFFTGIRSEGNLTQGMILGASNLPTSTGGTYNRIFTSSLQTIVDNSGGTSQVWGTTAQQSNPENHITNLAYLDTTLFVNANNAIIWNNFGGSAGLFWRAGTSGPIPLGITGNTNLRIFAGTSGIGGSVVLDGVNPGSSVRFDNQGVNKAFIDSSGFSTSSQIQMNGNIGVSFINANGGGSLGLAWFGGPLAVLSGQFVDNGAQSLWVAGTATVARDAVIKVSNTASTFKIQNNATDLITMSPTAILAKTYFYPNPITFASLGAPSSGAMVFCIDCLNASNPCTGAAGGAIAKRIGAAWDCR